MGLSDVSDISIMFAARAHLYRSMCNIVLLYHMKCMQPCSLAIFVCLLTAWIAPGPLHLSGFNSTPIKIGDKVHAAYIPPVNIVRKGTEYTQVHRVGQNSSLDHVLSSHMAWQAAALKRLTGGSKNSSFPGVILVKCWCGVGQQVTKLRYRWVALQLSTALYNDEPSVFASAAHILG